MVIERATERGLGDVLRRRFFDPLELDETYSQAAGEPPVAGALGYLQRASGPEGLDDGTNYRPTMSAATVAFAAGDIISSARDMADWARMLYGGEVVSQDSLALMTDYTYAPQSGESYGMGTRTRVFDGSRMFGHTGSLRGFSGAMWHFPAEQLTIVVLTNRGRIDANPIVDALAAPILPVVRQVAAT
jgi:D-alanyl-D-alanine carboxypeptidase